MSTTKRFALTGIVVGILGVTSGYAQFGGGGADWNTTGLNAQRTSWVKTDKYISKEVIDKGDFQFQWKLKTENPTQ
jgi:hypothetical protein